MKLINKFTFIAVPLLAAASLLWLVGCNEEEQVETPDFTASTPGTVFKVGEPVVFSFEGNPDFIIFYSGEPGNAYDFRDHDRIEKLKLPSLSSHRQRPDKRAMPIHRVPGSFIRPISTETTAKRA